MLRILTLVTLCQIGAACVSSTGIGDACKCDFTPENGVAGGKNTASGATYNFACNTGYVSDGGAKCEDGSWSDKSECVRFQVNMPVPPIEQY